MQKKLIVKSAFIPALKLESQPRKWTTEWSYDLKKTLFDVEKQTSIQHILQLIADSLPFFRFSAILTNFDSDRASWDKRMPQSWQTWFESIQYDYNSNPTSDYCEIPLILKMDLVLKNENQQLMVLEDWYQLNFIYDNRVNYEVFSLPFTIQAHSVLFEDEKYRLPNLKILAKGFKKLQDKMKKMGATLVIDQTVYPLDKSFLEGLV